MWTGWFKRVWSQHTRMSGYRLRAKFMVCRVHLLWMHAIAEVSAFNHFGLRDQSIQRNVKPILGSVFFISSIVFDEEISCSAEIDFHVESDTIQLTMSFPLLSHERIAPTAHTKHDAHHAKHTSFSILRCRSESIHFDNVFRSSVSKHILTGMYSFFLLA